ncbi:MAG: thioredoxin family protein [Alloprevotella sp.]|nr:thioredoxin family protein [Alloprevotella sp.]
MKKISLLLFAFLSVALSAFAQVDFKVTQKRVSPTEIDLVFTGKIQPGWHVYSTNIPEGGPVKARFATDKASGCAATGALKPGGGAKTAMDEIFEMKVTYFENTCTFTQRVKLTEKNYELKGYLEFGACNDENCMPPTTVDYTLKGADGPDGAAAEAAKKEAETEQAAEETPEAAQEAAVPADSAAADSAAAVAVADTDSATIASWYKPSIDQMNAFGEENSATGRSLWYIFLMGLLGGFIALVTPCVWPIIPMTVSFFLKRADDKAKGIRDAVLYGVSIVVIYVALGLVVTSIFGTNALNDLSTNAIFNIFLFVLLVVFAASFMGGFEITLPSSWSNRIDEKASATTGMLSIFLMALTLTLVSFSCTGPIIGFLLVEVTTEGGSMLAPTIGMLGFALALALPFTLFALFPTWLKKAPKSGGWMNVVKVVLGFIELAFALKFLSVADLAYGWHLLDREAFLCLWIAIFGTLAAYLFGWIKFPHDDADEKNIGVTRFFVGLCSLAFSIYMIPGLWGAPCKAVSAFAPPITTQDFNLDPVKVEAKFRDYEKGMAYAKQTGKPVLLDFTGFGCVNCRKMELAVWHDAKVRDLLNKDYVLISLYVDDKTRLPEPIEVETNGKKRTLRTVGDRWSYLEETKFGANTQPLYVPVDNEGNALNHSASYDEDIDKYVRFLREGLERYNK